MTCVLFLLKIYIILLVYFPFLEDFLSHLKRLCKQIHKQIEHTERNISFSLPVCVCVCFKERKICRYSSRGALVKTCFITRNWVFQNNASARNLFILVFDPVNTFGVKDYFTISCNRSNIKENIFLTRHMFLPINSPVFVF